MKITLSKKSIELSTSSDLSNCYGLILSEGFADQKSFQSIASALCSGLASLLSSLNFTGAAGQICLIPVLQGDKAFHVICAGIGKQSKSAIPVEQFRRAIGRIIQAASRNKVKALILALPEATVFGSTPDYIVQQAVIIAKMANYQFDDFITDKDRKATPVAELVLCPASGDIVSDTAMTHGEIIGHAVNQTRHWIDMPPSHMTPPHLADAAFDITQKRGLKYTMFNESQINEMGMGGLAGVSRGSEIECRLLIMEYTPAEIPTNKPLKTIAFVGKGITFDSGGLSIKPARNMENMKDDMSGAAGVISVMEAISYLKPGVRVIGITPLAENLPSGSALKPGDIVTFYNGKTAEVKNTDAEGRLILADALSYAVKHYKPDAIVDIATLTGACAYALGPFYSGLMGQNEPLIAAIESAAQTSGDPVWRLPMSDDYAKAIQSTIADICNIGNERYMAGAVTAAHFLKHFVGDTPWAHLDIAGTAFDVPDLPYYRPGSTASGVRLLIELAMQWEK